jgi:hypothetical protein
VVMMTIVGPGVDHPQSAPPPAPTRSPRPGHDLRGPAGEREVAGRTRNSDTANVGSPQLSRAWNFSLASLYKAAMLRLPVPAHDHRAAARRARVAGDRPSAGSHAGFHAGFHAGSHAPRRATRGLALAALFSSMTLSLTAHAQSPASPEASPASPKAGTTATAKAPKAARSANAPKAAPAPSRGGNKQIALDDE